MRAGTYEKDDGSRSVGSEDVVWLKALLIRYSDF
jgi:hypothetical protein